jgi:hypothetical protein
MPNTTFGVFTYSDQWYEAYFVAESTLNGEKSLVLPLLSWKLKVLVIFSTLFAMPCL